MNAVQRKQLEGILQEAESRRRPVLGYAEMSPEEIVAVWLYGCWLALTTVALVKLASRNLPNRQDERDQIATQALNLTREVIFDLANEYYEPRHFEILSEVMFERPFLMQELSKRVQDRAIAVHLSLLPMLQTLLPALSVDDQLTQQERNLKIERIKPFSSREREYDSNDIKQEGMLKALGIVKDQSRFESSSLDLSLHPEIRDPWNIFVAEIWDKPEVRDGLARVTGALSVNDDTVRQKVRDHLRNWWETIDRQRKFRERQQDEITASIRPKRRTDDDVDITAIEINKLVSRARRERQPKVALALKYCAQGITQEKACRLAGIRPRTLQRYISKIRRESSLT